MKRNKKRLNNKGFSLVELIVVIAIMAILVGVLAPQVMKYVGKSRTSVDTTNCDAIKSAVQTALANEEAYEDMQTRLNVNNVSTVSFSFNGSAPTTIGDVGGSGTDDKFITELDSIIGDWPEVKNNTASNFVVTINDDLDVSVVTQ